MDTDTLPGTSTIAGAAEAHIDEYYHFLETKIDVAETSGLDIEYIELHPSTKPHQADAIRWMLRNGRGLLAESFGLGKTHQQIEALRVIHELTGKLVMVVCPLGVRHQFIQEDGIRLGMTWQYVRTDAELAGAVTPFIVTNYERIRDGNIDPHQHEIAAVSLDEGSVMRSLGSKTYQVFNEALSQIPYRYVATATPSPNEYRELIYYAEFLGIKDHGEALTRWFERDVNQAGNLQLRKDPENERDFWLWVASWALFLFTPSDLGYSNDGYALPPLIKHEHRLPVDQTRAWDHTDNHGQGLLLLDTTLSATAAAQEKRATLDARIEKMLEIIATDPEANWIIWHDLEDERRAIEKALPGVVTVYGSLDHDEKERRVLDFAHGKIKLFASKPELSGYGSNFQYACHKNIFLGVGYKFQDFIQSVHRTYRFQQQHPVDVHIIYAESEEKVMDSLTAKWKRHDELIEVQRGIVQEFGLSRLAIMESKRRKLGTTRQAHRGQLFTSVNNDCVVECMGLPSNSVDLIATSIPFSNHYEYVASYNDFGHNADDDRFFQQMDFLIPELYRILIPGRVAAIHCKDIVRYGHLNASGFMEIAPFVARTLFAFLKHGFLFGGEIEEEVDGQPGLFGGEITIPTDVVRENNATYRLGWSEMCRDGSKMGVGLPEKVLLFRKPPTSTDTARSDKPVRHDKAKYTRARWQIDAHSHWKSNGQNPLAYDYLDHVARLEDLDELHNLPSKYFCEPPKSNNPLIWDDINAMRCLNAEQARHGIKKHVCPLPFDICERLIERFTSDPEVTGEAELVLDPFGGLGTVAYCALQLGRRGYSIELSPEYWQSSVRYCQQMEDKMLSTTLFDLLPAEKAA